MWRIFVRVVRCLVVVAATTSIAAAEDRPLVSNVFFQSDLRQALEDVAAQAKVNIIADQSVHGVVSVTLESVTVDKALQLLLAGTDYQVQVTPEMRTRLDDLLGTGSYRLMMARPQASSGGGRRN